jgi:hypothetical protein
MRLQHAQRQNSGVSVAPSASGVGGSLTASDPSGTKLVIGTGTGTGPSSTDGPDFAVGRCVSQFICPGIAVVTTDLYPSSSIVITSTLTSTKSPSQSSSPAQSGANSRIALSTVIGICVGVFVGAGLLICFSIWFYRRSSRRPPPRARQKQPITPSRGVNHTAPWTRFDDDQDRWDGRKEMSEKGLGDVALAPGFQRTSPHSSRRSPTTEEHFGSQYDVTSHSRPFSHYHPKVTEQMALGPPRPVGLDDQTKTSLDGSTNGTFLSLGTVHIESGKMSPTFSAAKMTPPATASMLHRWESAEVIDPESHAQEVEVHSEPFSENSTPTTYSPMEASYDRRSFHNPFFNAHPGVHSRRPSTTRKSTMSTSSDPFNGDEEIMTMPKPRFVSHTTHASSSSGGSFGNEKAIQSLIAALELPKDVVEDRLRIASMQPSEASRYSTGSDTFAAYPMPIPETAEQGYVR